MNDIFIHVPNEYIKTINELQIEVENSRYGSYPDNQFDANTVQALLDKIIELQTLIDKDSDILTLQGRLIEKQREIIDSQSKEIISNREIIANDTILFKSFQDGMSKLYAQILERDTIIADQQGQLDRIDMIAKSCRQDSVQNITPCMRDCENHYENDDEFDDDHESIWGVDSDDDLGITNPKD